MLMGEIVIIHTVTKKSEMIQTSDSSGRVRHVMFSRENENWCCGTMYRFKSSFRVKVTELLKSFFIYRRPFKSEVLGHCPFI